LWTFGDWEEFKMKSIKAISIMILLLYIPACHDVGNNYVINLPTPNPLVTEGASESGAEQGKKGEAVRPKSESDFIIEPQYDHCDMPVDGIIGTQKGNGDDMKHGFIDIEGKVITDAIYDETKYYIGASSMSSGFSQGMAPVKRNGKWGYIDMKGNAATDFEYEDADLFNDGLARITLNGKYGYINKTGEIVIEPQYESSSEFHDGVAAAMLNNKYGFISKRGEWIIKPIYDSVDFGRYDRYWTKSSMLQITVNDLTGIAKVEKGMVKIIVEPKYTNLFPFYEGEAKFVILYKDKDGQYGSERTEGFINKDGAEIFKWSSKDEEGEMYEYISEGMRLYRNSKKLWGFVDINFKTVIPCLYERAEQFYSGFALIYKGDKVGLVDKKGKVLIEPKYDTIIPILEEGYAITQKEDRMCLVSTNTFKPISREYDVIGRGGKVMPVIEKGKVGFIYNDGRELIAPQFEECETFAFWEDYAWVKQNGKWICIDQYGKQKFQGEFEGISLFQEGLAAVKAGGKWGVVDKEGTVVIPYAYEEASVAAKGLIKVKLKGKYGFIKK
jgi:hypothetical protein